MLFVGHRFDYLDSHRARPCNQGQRLTSLTIHGTWLSIQRVFHEYISSDVCVCSRGSHVLQTRGYHTSIFCLIRCVCILGGPMFCKQEGIILKFVVRLVYSLKIILLLSNFMGTS
jgi:hypothetical protein